MKVRKHMISRVLPDSIAEELGLEPGDRLVSVNGQPVEDVFDYRYLMNEELVVLLVEKPDGEEWELEVEKEYEEDLGIEFENGGLMDDYRSCSNKCMFCFIDQMPQVCVRRCILRMMILGFPFFREIMLRLPI